MVTTYPLIETALYGRSVEEVYAAGKPHPSLQGCIYGVFRNRSPIDGRTVTNNVYILGMYKTIVTEYSGATHEALRFITTRNLVD